MRRQSPGIEPRGGAGTKRRLLVAVISAACLLVWSGGVSRAQPRTERLAFVESVVGGARSEDTLPLVVAIHGLGDTPESFVRLFANLPVAARVIAPRGPRAHGTGWTWDPYRAALPRVASLVEQVRRERPFDGRAVVTGFSQGGIMSFAIAVNRPELLDVALPVSGRLPAELRPPAPRATAQPARIIAFHGDADRVVPYAPTRDTVAMLARGGAAAELRTFPGVGHTITREMRDALFLEIGRALARDTAHRKSAR